MGKASAEQAGVGLRGYYRVKIEELELQIKDKSHNLRRLEAQRNELNTQGAFCAPTSDGPCTAAAHMRILSTALRRRSPAASRGAAAAAGARLLCWRGHQGAVWHGGCSAGAVQQLHDHQPPRLSTTLCDVQREPQLIDMTI